MASYFDVQPPSKATAEVVDVPDGHVLKHTGMLTPQVTRILDDFDLDLEEHSSSGDEASLSEDSDSRPDDGQDPRKVYSPLEGTKNVRLEPPPLPSSGTGGGKLRQPRMARFHSLRTMLFSSRIEDGMAKHNEERAKAEAEEKWRVEHEQRRGLNRPKTPESPTRSPTKESFAHRMGDKLRRMTSKEVPTMKSIGEDNDNESTASSEDEDEYDARIRATRGSDNESINHSDVEDLRRWVSRRDPPSDGEVRKKKQIPAGDVNSGHESLGNSDVEDLVRWVSRRDPETGAETDMKLNYSDASTEQDSEAGGSRRETMNDDDADELVRWISHKEGPKAGPVREPKVSSPVQTKMNQFEKAKVSGDLSRSVTRRNDSSGDVPGDEGTSELASKPRKSEKERGSLAPQDIDELVRFASRKEKSAKPNLPDEEPRGRSLTRDSRATLTNDDVDDLTKWVSRREQNPKEEEQRDDGILKSKEEENEQKRKELGMKHEKQGSLQPGDVDDLVKWVSRREQDPKANEKGDDDTFKWQQEENEKNKEGMKHDKKGSLQPDDVDDLVRWVSRK